MHAAVPGSFEIEWPRTSMSERRARGHSQGIP